MSQEMSVQHLETPRVICPSATRTNINPAAVEQLTKESEQQQFHALQLPQLQHVEEDQKQSPLLQAQPISPLQTSVGQPCKLLLGEDAPVFQGAPFLLPRRCTAQVQPSIQSEMVTIPHMETISSTRAELQPSMEAGGHRQPSEIAPIHSLPSPCRSSSISVPHVSELVYPEALATHLEVLSDQRLFFDTLKNFHAAFGETFMTIPKIGEKDLDLHLLYREVTARGGLEAVINDQKWKEITEFLNLFPITTGSSYILCKIYTSLLHHYEKVYFFRIRGRIIPPPAATNVSSPVLSQMADTDVKSDVLDEVDSEINKAIGTIDSAQALGVDPASSVGRVVSGTIDGKFDHGYFVTVMVGTRKMRGVLYHVPSNNPVPQNATVPALVNNIGLELRLSDVVPKVKQWRRRKNVSRKDPNAPRQNKTGYNYFFAEQRAKLKLLQPDKDRVISKIIGDLWNKLSKDEKSPYQERGLRDKERYKREMKEYRERVKLQAICKGNNDTPFFIHPSKGNG